MRLTVLTVPDGEVDVAADRLWEAGAAAIEERTEPGGWVALLTVLATADEVSAERIGGIPKAWSLGFVDRDEPPSQAWRDHVCPVEVNAELVLHPAWVRADEAADRTTVFVEPGGAFGLGDHPTTRLSADAAWRLTSPGDRVLDVGSGSGVLAIVCLLRGAEAAVAIDVADAAREATLDNADRNGVSDRLTASCLPLTEVNGSFDLVLANILAPTLTAMADDLVRVVRPGGHLVVSGVLAEHHGHVVEALDGLTVVARHIADAWACLELVRPVA